MLSRIRPQYYQCSVLSSLIAWKLLYQATTSNIPISGSVYCGYDPTVHSLHLGNLISILNLAKLAQIGFKPIAIVGGATVQLGDPSFKMEEQKEPDLLVIQENLQKIRKQLESVYRNIAKSFQDRIAIINT